MKPILIALFALFPVLAAAPAHAVDVSVACSPPAKYTDGTIIPVGTNMAFKFFGALQGQAKQLLTPVALGTCAFTQAAAVSGTYCYEVTAIAGGQESDHSLEACKAVTVAKPKPEAPEAPTITVTAISPTAYSVIKGAESLVLIPVGTLPLGTACDTSQGVIRGGNVFNVVPTAVVSYTGTARPLVVLAACG
jgi:hypothetical protein